MSSEIALQQPAMTFAEQMQYAKTVCQGSLVPSAYRGQPANVLIAMDFGRSMGLSPAESLYRITVINGRPSASAELIAANVRRAGHRLRVKKDDRARKATCEIVRRDDPDFTFTATWDMAKAQQANLSGKENWRKYPMAMLTARSITECARDACPEALYGVVYTGEELGASQTGPDGAAEPVAVEATVERAPEVDLQPVRDLFGPYKTATGRDNASATAAICAAVGCDGGMHDMTQTQARRAASWMEEEIAAARAAAEAEIPVDPAFDGLGMTDDEIRDDEFVGEF